MATVNLLELEKRIEAGLITKRQHPHAELWIYNYTPEAQFTRAWDEYTIMCRGLILDKAGNIMARPFPKFFNLEEHQGTIPSEPFVVHEKLDGSLGILYWHRGVPLLATRGSFESGQAMQGTLMLQELLGVDPEQFKKQWNENTYVGHDSSGQLLPGYTYLVEIIYPDNRIVVDYGSERKLVLLAIINNETGEELPIKHYGHVFKYHATEYDGIADITKLRTMFADTSNHEGFVVRFTSGLRLKIKMDEYVRLHRILTNTNNVVVWEIIAVEEMLMHYPELTAKQLGENLHLDKNVVQQIIDRNGKSLAGLLKNVPDEFYGWLQEQINAMHAAHQAAMAKARAVLADTTDRVTIVRMCGDDTSTRGIAFALLDGKLALADSLAWRFSRPQWSKPFVTDYEA